MSKTFGELFEESVIVQAVITLIVTLLIAAMYIVPMIAQLYGVTINVDTPEELWALVGLIYGWYFKSKADVAAKRDLKETRESFERTLVEISRGQRG